MNTPITPENYPVLPVNPEQVMPSTVVPEPVLPVAPAITVAPSAPNLGRATEGIMPNIVAQPIPEVPAEIPVIQPINRFDQLANAENSNLPNLELTFSGLVNNAEPDTE